MLTTRKENNKAKKEIDIEHGKAIIEAWDEIINFIKACIKNNPNVMAIDANRLEWRISKYLFESFYYLKSARVHFINYETTSFSNFISKDKIMEIYSAISKKRAYFGNNWGELHRKFDSFWNIRFKVDPNSRNYEEKFNDYMVTLETIKRKLYERLRDIFAENLGLSEVSIKFAFITKVLEPHLSEHGLSKSGKQYIFASIIFRMFSKTKDLSEQSIIEAARQCRRGPLFRLKLANIRNLHKLRSEIEQCLINFYMSDISGLEKAANIREKILFDSEIFYIIYKNTPLNERGKLSLESIRNDIYSFTVLNNIKKHVTMFGKHTHSSYRWNSIVTLTTFMRQKMGDSKISRPDYVKFLRASERFCTELLLSPTKPNGYYSRLGIHISDSNINNLNVDDKDTAGNKFLHHLYKLNNLKKGEVSPDFKHAVKFSVATIRASTFSKDPYSINKGFTESERLDYIKTFTNSIEYGTSHKDFQQLIEYAQLRDNDNFILKDANLLSLINPSTIYNNQPSHPFIEYLALKNILSIICTEPLIWAKIEDVVYSGHLDIIQIKKDTIRIIDYKPNLHFDPEAKTPANHFIDSIPQIAAYGIIFDMMFCISQSKYQIECVTFNEEGHYLYNPYEALEDSVEFYYSIKHEMPVWHKLLRHDIIDKIIAKYSEK